MKQIFLDPERKLRMMEELRQILCLSIPASELCDAMDSTQNKSASCGKHNSNPHNARLALLGDSVLDLVVVEYLFQKNLPKGKIENYKQKLVSNETQHRLLNDIWKLTPYYFNNQGFSNDPDIEKPCSSANHIPYLEAIIGTVFLCNGFDYAKHWVLNVVCPGLVKASRCTEIIDLFLS